MGILNAGILSRVVTKFVGPLNIRCFKVRFETRAWPGDHVICSGRVTRKFEEADEKRMEGEFARGQPEGRDADQWELRRCALAAAVRTRAG